MEDPNNQQQDQSDTTQVTDPNANPEPTPQPPTPTGGDPTILAAYREQLLAESRERARLQRELDEARKPKEQPPTPEEEKEFFDKPKSIVRDLIRQEIREAVKPFNESAAQQQRAMLIAEIKRQMRAKPAQFPYIDQVEGLFDQILAQAAGIDANVAVAAYNTALGYHISQGGRLEAAAPKTDNLPTPNRGNVPVNNNPPHIRPSAPPTPPSNGTKKLRQLTENERKIARFNGQSDEEYLIWSGEMDPREVVLITDEDIKTRAK
jgi:hypothetical protein